MKTLRVLAIAAVATVAAPLVNAATVTYYSGWTNMTAVYQDYSVQKFNPALGTLTGITVFTEGGTISGSVTITNNDGVDLTIDGYLAQFQTRQDASNTIGYTTTFADIDPVSTSPTMVGATINPAQQQTFTIAASQTFAPVSQTINSGFFSEYTAASGNVVFEARSPQIIQTAGTDYTVQNNTTTPLRFGVTYTYEVIPEPSAALLGALGALGLLRRRR